MTSPHQRVLTRGVFGIVLAGLGLFYYRLAVHAETPLLDGDDAVYAVMADYFSFFSSRSDEITELVMRYSYFPPLYPLLLGVTGADSAHLWFAHLLTVGFLIGAMALFLLWLRHVVPSAASAMM